MGHVQGQRTDGGIAPGADGHRLEILRGLGPDDPGQVAADAVGQGAADELRRLLIIAVAVVLPGRHAVFELTLAHHDWQAGKRLHRDPASAISFDNRHFQVAVGAAGVNVADLEWARRHVGCVEDVVILANLHGRAGLGDTANDRRITALAVGAHAVVRG